MLICTNLCASCSLLPTAEHLGEVPVVEQQQRQQQVYSASSSHAVHAATGGAAAAGECLQQHLELNAAAGEGYGLVAAGRHLAG